MNRYEQLAPLLKDENGTSYRAGLSFLDIEYDGEWAFYKVRPEEAGRPELISYKVFKTPKLYWVICEVNNIRDPLKEIKANMNLAIPVQIQNYLSKTRAFTYGV